MTNGNTEAAAAGLAAAYVEGCCLSAAITVTVLDFISARGCPFVQPILLRKCPANICMLRHTLSVHDHVCSISTGMSQTFCTEVATLSSRAVADQHR